MINRVFIKCFETARERAKLDGVCLRLEKMFNYRSIRIEGRENLVELGGC